MYPVVPRIYVFVLDSSESLKCTLGSNGRIYLHFIASLRLASGVRALLPYPRTPRVGLRSSQALVSSVPSFLDGSEDTHPRKQTSLSRSYSTSTTCCRLCLWHLGTVMTLLEQTKKKSTQQPKWCRTFHLNKTASPSVYSIKEEILQPICTHPCTQGHRKQERRKFPKQHNNSSEMDSELKKIYEIPEKEFKITILNSTRPKWI